MPYPSPTPFYDSGGVSTTDSLPLYLPYSCYVAGNCLPVYKSVIAVFHQTLNP